MMVRGGPARFDGEPGSDAEPQGRFGASGPHPERGYRPSSIQVARKVTSGLHLSASGLVR